MLNIILTSTVQGGSHSPASFLVAELVTQLALESASDSIYHCCQFYVLGITPACVFRLKNRLVLCFLRLYTASGDERTNGDKYVYQIQLSGIINSSSPECFGANICQVKTNERRVRRVGSARNAKYYVDGKYLLTRENCLIFCELLHQKMVLDSQHLC